MPNPFDSDLGKTIVSISILITAIAFGLAIDYYKSINALLGVLNNFSNSIYRFLTFNWINAYEPWFVFVLMIFIAIIAIFLAILIFKMIRYLLTSIFDLISDYLKEKEFVKNKIIQMESILELEVKNDFQDLKNEIETIRELIEVSMSYKRLNCFTNVLKERLKTCLKLLEPLKKRIMLNALKNEILVNERKNEELKEKIRINETHEEPSGYDLVYRLGALDKNVFKKYGLSENQVKALEKHGFSQLNEYSIVEHSYVRYLIKPELNHSPTHTFLVWDTKRLLETIKGITKIQENLTVDADITFMFNNKKYALEIEIGSLLGKKQQAKEKVEYLNKKYQDRWMFIVSNKNLLPKYQELGFSTQRSRVLDNLKKLLKIA